MQQPIIGYHKDEQGHWVAQLACGHNQHVRHDPPMMVRDWVTTHSTAKNATNTLRSMNAHNCAEERRGMLRLLI